MFDYWNCEIVIDLIGMMLGCKYGVKVMKEYGGVIVNISLIEGMIGDLIVLVYNVVKGGVCFFIKLVVFECVEKGYVICVNLIYFGVIVMLLIDYFDDVIK